jgi:LPS-assembly lipoprotein
MLLWHYSSSVQYRVEHRLTKANKFNIVNIQQLFSRFIHSRSSWMIAGSLALSFAMAGCGWQLRAGVRLPPAVMPVKVKAVDRYSDFYLELNRSLIESGATLVSGTDAAGATIHISSDVVNATVQSVSSRNTPEEYLVSYSIEYAIEFGGQQVVPMQALGLSSSYSYDSQAVLAKQRERSGVQKALARELARQVLQRLASVKPPA